MPGQPELLPNSVSPWTLPGTALKPFGGGLRPDTFAGALLAGNMVYKLSDLVGLSYADTILIQHTFGTGLIWLCPVTNVPLYYEDFEGRALGDLVGQDGWVLDAASTYGQAIVTQSALCDGVRNITVPSTNLLTPNLFRINRPITPVVLGQFIRVGVTFYMPDIATTDAIEFRLYAAGALACSLVVGSSVAGAVGLAVLDSTGAAFAAPATTGNARHRIEVTLDCTAALTIAGCTLDGVPVAVAGGSTVGGLPDSIALYSSSNDDLADIGHLDTLEVTPLEVTGGLPVPDGTGERLEAQLVPIDLRTIGFYTDGVNDPTVNIFVLGA